MRCESCRSGDPVCNAWIDCAGPIVPDNRQSLTVIEAEVGQNLTDFGQGCRRCGGEMRFAAGFDEDDPYTEPRMARECVSCWREAA